MTGNAQKNAMIGALIEKSDKIVPDGPVKEPVAENKFSPIDDIIEQERASYDEGGDMKTAITNIISGLQTLLEGLGVVAEKSPVTPDEETA